MQRQRGFTAVELVVAIAIIGLLVAIAVPSYQAHQRKTRASAAWSFMYEIASKEELYRADARQYTNSLADLGLSVPANVTAYYTISINGAPTGFTIGAVPTGVMSGTNTLSLNDRGLKTGG